MLKCVPVLVSLVCTAEARNVVQNLEVFLIFVLFCSYLLSSYCHKQSVLSSIMPALSFFLIFFCLKCRSLQSQCFVYWLWHFMLSLLPSSVAMSGSTYWLAFIHQWYAILFTLFSDHLNYQACA